MGWEAWYTLLVMGALFVLLVSSRVAPAVILLGGLTLLFAAGILTPDEALSGLANEGVVTVALLFIVGGGVRETGGIDWIAQRLLGRPENATAAMARLMPPTAAISAFTNSTPLVAMLIPVVNDWAKKQQLSVSKLMIPLSYAAILGGTCTLIGTSTNLLVNGMWIAHQGTGLGMFEISKIGVPCAVIGCAYVLLSGRWLLPDRRPAINETDDPRQYTVEMIVEPGSPLVGQTIEEAGLRHLPGVYLAEIDREGRVLAAVSPEEQLLARDQLVFVGIVESVADLQRIRGLKPATDQVFKLTAPRSTRCLIEAVVSDSCPLVGKTIRDGRFRSVYSAVVVAVARAGKRIHSKIGDIILRPGDTLLLEASPSFVERQRNSRDFFLVSQIADSHPPRHEQALLAIGILVAMVGAVALGGLSILKAAALAAALMLITRCLSISSAKRSINIDVLLVIAASLGISVALQKTGVAGGIAENLIGLAGGHPWAALALVYLATLLVTEAITNNAAAAIMFPLALATASNLDVNAMPFVIAVMMAASAGFATPIGYQTNLMVYGPGGYHFNDYVRIGVPLDLLVGLLTVGLTPLIWRF